MAAERQQTLASEVALEGIGVHSGQQSRLRIKPAADSFGVRFRRTDLPGAPEVPARLECVTHTDLGTTLGRDGAEVMTVEHVLAALAALEVDNALVELDGPEPPILDGSFAPYVAAVTEAGVKAQGAPASVVRLSAPVTAGDGRVGSYVAVPDDGFRVSATIDYPHPAIRRQHGSYCATGNAFAEELAGARTFGFKADADALHARGRALGASLDNTVVLDDARVMNDGLRFTDEFVRHKAGDIVGDLALLGSRFRGHVVADRPSHAGNFKLASAISERHGGGPGSGAIDVRLSAPVTAGDGRVGSYVAVPDDGFRVSATIDYPHPAIRRQHGSYCATGNAFAEELAGARTFGFKADADALHARGRALGASLDNTVVLDDARVMNDGLRFTDEFVRHKAGDIVGDLALLGSRFRGHVVADRPSHAGNFKLASAISERHGGGPGSGAIDVRRIMDCLPHRYPMLLVDRVLEFESRKRIVGLKNVTINEPFFGGHFPEHPIMPGVLIVEAMGQVGGLLLMDAVDDPEGKVVYFMSLDNVKWRRPVVPGDQLVFELEMLHFRRQVCKMRGTSTVDGRLVAQAEMTARIMDR